MRVHRRLRRSSSVDNGYSPGASDAWGAHRAAGARHHRETQEVETMYV